MVYEDWKMTKVLELYGRCAIIQSSDVAFQKKNTEIIYLAFYYLFMFII